MRAALRVLGGGAACRCMAPDVPLLPLLHDDDTTSTTAPHMIPGHGQFRGLSFVQHLGADGGSMSFFRVRDFWTGLHAGHDDQLQTSRMARFLPDLKTTEPQFVDAQKVVFTSSDPDCDKLIYMGGKQKGNFLRPHSGLPDGWATKDISVNSRLFTGIWVWSMAHFAGKRARAIENRLAASRLFVDYCTSLINTLPSDIAIEAKFVQCLDSPQVVRLNATTGTIDWYLPLDKLMFFAHPELEALDAWWSDAGETSGLVTTDLREPHLGSLIVGVLLVAEPSHSVLLHVARILLHVVHDLLLHAIEQPSAVPVPTIVDASRRTMIVPHKTIAGYATDNAVYMKRFQHELGEAQCVSASHDDSQAGCHRIASNFGVWGDSDSCQCGMFVCLFVCYLFVSALRDTHLKDTQHCYRHPHTTLWHCDTHCRLIALLRSLFAFSYLALCSRMWMKSVVKLLT